MAALFGIEPSREELSRWTGDLRQIAGVRMMELSDGPETGVRIADVRTGSGLRFQVSLDRGMDISAAEFKGIPLAWRSAVGDVHPRFFEPGGKGWLRSFAGGLMTGCGMTQAGAPGTDEGEELGLHGRLSHLPASEVRSTTTWEGNRCFFRVEGAIREWKMFGENLLLRRCIETELGSSLITIRDRVVNEGSAPSPIMMLYHCNLGWPLVSPASRLLLNASSEEPRDEEAAKGMSTARTFVQPTEGFQEQVFRYSLKPDGDGFGCALMHNEDLGIGCSIRFRLKELPRFMEWKMMGEGMYVVGLEPANCLTGGRAAERKNGTLQFLQPAEEREFVVCLQVLEGSEVQTLIKDQNLR